MTTMHEEQRKVAPEPLALVQSLVNTQYGQARRAHTELTNPEQLRIWLVAHSHCSPHDTLHIWAVSVTESLAKSHESEYD